MKRILTLGIFFLFCTTGWSQVFNEACYLNRYPDVRLNWAGSALDHWLRNGQFENRIPGCTNQAPPPANDQNTFNESCYLQRYPDVRNGWSSTALDHWIRNGQRENRIPGCGGGITAAPIGGGTPPVSTGAFNESCYLQRYPDVRLNWRGRAIDHWTSHGSKENRIPGCGGGIVPGPIVSPTPVTPAPTPAPNPAPTPVFVGNTTIIGSGAMPISISIDGPRFGGAVSSLNWNGKEFINIHDHGRQLQSAMQVDGFKECNNPTEAGSEHDGTGSRSSSVMTAFNKQASNILLTEANMAYWNYRTTTGACVKGKDPRVNQPLSNHMLNKRIQIGDLGDPRVIKYDVQFRHPVGSYNESLTYEFLTGYLTPDFNQYAFIQPSGGLVMITPASYINISGNGFPVGSFQALPTAKGRFDPIILTNASGSHAMGVYVPRSQLTNCRSDFHGYGMYYFNLGGSGPNASGTAKWSLAVDDKATSSCIRGNSRSFVVYLSVGTLAEAHQSLVRVMNQIK